jgi:hypothetical protein
MSQAKQKLTICRTCVRDNYGEGIFSDVDQVEKAYRERLKARLWGTVAEVGLQNCFTECENFHCVQVEHGQAGFRLKKISSLEKIDQVTGWIRDIQQSGRLDLPEGLISNLIEPIKVPKD